MQRKWRHSFSQDIQDVVRIICFRVMKVYVGAINIQQSICDWPCFALHHQYRSCTEFILAVYK